MLPDYQVLCIQSKTRIDFDAVICNSNVLTQFILDPSSFNLENRVNVCDPILPSLFQLSRDYCNAIHVRRMKIIQTKGSEETK